MLISQRSVMKGLLSCFAMLFVITFNTASARELPDFTELAAANNPAVVNISTTKKAAKTLPEQLQIPKNSPFGELFKHFFGEDGIPGVPEEDAKSLGSGFIISADGYVLTNHHVISEADEILVRLSDKRSLQAKLIGSDRYSDVALLKIEADKLPVVHVGDSTNLKVGEWVLAIGSPYGFDHSVTAGIVSAKGRTLPKDAYVPFIQTDVAINPGNSGGPLFNMDGEVVGINSQIYTNTGGFMGLSFAIPIEVAMDIVEQLKKTGHVTRGWLGVYIQEVTQDLAESFGLEQPEGALVSQVIEGSPAEKYGIKPGDVILKFNDERVSDSARLPILVGAVAAGKTVNVVVLRNGKTKNLRVKIGEMPTAEEEKEVKSIEQTSYDRIGVHAKSLSDDDKTELEVTTGVVVQDVKPGSSADNAGIKRGDVILQLNHKTISTADDFEKIVTDLPKNKPVPVLVLRSGGRQFLALKITE